MVGRHDSNYEKIATNQHMSAHGFYTVFQSKSYAGHVNTNAIICVCMPAGLCYTHAERS